MTVFPAEDRGSNPFWGSNFKGNNMRRDVKSKIYVIARLSLRGLPLIVRKEKLSVIRSLLGGFNPGQSETDEYISYDDKNKRMKTKTGRFLRGKLKLELTDRKLETITAKLNTLLYGNLIIRLDKGKKILDNYRHKIGSGSCMTGSECDYVRLYADNPDVYSQLVMLSGNNSARAMVVKLSDGNTFLDRIYTDSPDFLRQKMVDYAAKSDWLCRGDDLPTMITPPLDFEDGFVPYQDTLTRGTVRRGKLILSNHSIGDDFDMCTTDGFFMGGRYECVSCGSRLNEDDCYNFEDETYCCDCYSERFIRCECCESDVSRGDVESVDDKCVCSSCLERYYTRCEQCGEYVNCDDSFAHAGNSYCEDCYNDLEKCECCDEISDDLSRIDGHDLCPDCEDKRPCKQCHHWIDKTDDGLCADCMVGKMGVKCE